MPAQSITAPSIKKARKASTPRPSVARVGQARGRLAVPRSALAGRRKRPATSAMVRQASVEMSIRPGSGTRSTRREATPAASSPAMLKSPWKPEKTGCPTRFSTSRPCAFMATSVMPISAPKVPSAATKLQ